MQKIPLKSYRDLIAWQRAMSLVDAVFALTSFLRSSRSSLASQLERAVISIPANIAEGYGRSSRAEYLHFLSIAAASLREVETLILIVQRNGLANSETLTELLKLADETGRVLHGLRKSLRRTADSAQKWPS